MGIKEEIFEEFFSALQGEKDIPESVVEELKQLVERGERISEEKVLDLIGRGCQNGGEDKKD